MEGVGGGGARGGGGGGRVAAAEGVGAVLEWNLNLNLVLWEGNGSLFDVFADIIKAEEESFSVHRLK